MAKITREKFKTYDGVFDQFTIRGIYKLISQGHFDHIQSPISTGKEAQVFSAITKDNKKVIMKIYRLETCDFNRMYDYIRYDPKFVNLKKQRRKVVFEWAKREYHNLLKLRQLNVKVPKPITVLNNILVMEFIGDDEAAPKLKDQIPEDLDNFFKKTFKYMKIFHDNKLVHSDLSDFNILNYNENPVFIDVSQTMPLENLQAREFEIRDIKNVCNFFKKYGLELDQEEIEAKIKQNLKTNPK